MNYDTTRLEPGLYIVATPIGAARDITLRALDILASADVLAAEDTRVLKHLMSLHGIPLGDRPVLSHHEHGGRGGTERLLAHVAAGRSVAYASDAGTPMISDPGFELARAAIAEGLPLTTAPGPSAAVAALTLSGLPTDRFLFAGFAPSKPAARRRWLADLAGLEVTLVLYESPRRLADLLAALADASGPERPVAVCREITKRFEQVLRGTAGSLAEELRASPVKGECVVVAGPPVRREAGEAEITAALSALPRDLSLRDAAAEVAATLGVPRKQAYQLALLMREGQPRDGDA